MKTHSKKLLIIALSLIHFQGLAQTNLLDQCLEKQKKALENQTISFGFTDSSNELEHSFYPWQQTNYQIKGQIWLDSSTFSKSDTLFAGQKTYHSKSVLTDKELLRVDYDENELAPISNEKFQDHLVKTARYSPTLLLSHFGSNASALVVLENDAAMIYEKWIGKIRVQINIEKSTHLVSKVSTLHHDKLFGDVVTEYAYSNYVEVRGLFLAQDIIVRKINRKLLDEVHLTNPQLMHEIPTIIERPENYALIQETPAAPEIATEKYNEHVHLLQLKHTDDRVMLVEFEDFLLVAEAPLNSENGELIIEEARKIAPQKPIKYFVFGHYHPHYLGGIRPFVHKGARIIASEQNQDYVSYLVNAPHTLNPDSLQMEPKSLIFEEFKDSLRIADAKTEMIIYFIGEKSAHTMDYLIYYFPNEKVLFEDDLAWIPQNGEMRKAGKRQAGLYRAIKELGLDVKTIIQSWPVTNYGVKTIIPFEDLERASQIE